MSRPNRRNGAAYLHRHRVLAQADTRLSPMGRVQFKLPMAVGSAALRPCSLRTGSLEPPVRHDPIVLRCPGNGPETPSLEAISEYLGSHAQTTGAVLRLARLADFRFEWRKIRRLGCLSGRGQVACPKCASLGPPTVIDRPTDDPTPRSGAWELETCRSAA